MANTLNLGTDGNWATKEGSVLGYNSENNNYKPLPFEFERAGNATRVNKEGLIEVVGNNEPRIDYKDNSEGALLLEPTRTNAIRYSSDFSEWGVKSNVTINSNVGLAPDGTLSADRIVFNGTTNARVEDGVQGINATSYTNNRPNSVWLKSESGTTTIQFGSSSAYLQTVTVTEEWQRFTYISKQGFPRIKSDNAASVLAWGYQFETNGDVSLSYATSYIPTSGGIATRNAESCNGGEGLPIFSNTSAVWFIDFSRFGYDSDINAAALILRNSSDVEQIRFHFDYPLQQVRFRDAKNSLANIGGIIGVLANTRKKVALKIDGTTLKVFADGIQVGSDYSRPTAFDFDNIRIVGSSFKLLDTRIYNTALTDQELIALTS